VRRKTDQDSKELLPQNINPDTIAVNNLVRDPTFRNPMAVNATAGGVKINRRLQTLKLTYYGFHHRR
jgi:hypothetical protein